MHKKCDGKQIFLKYPPKYITIAICGYCMNVCEFYASHCPDSGKNESSNHQYNIPYIMSYEDFCKIVDLCYAAKIPHIHIVASGEPFLQKEIFRMIDYLASKYHNITLQTNFSKKIFKNSNYIEKILCRKHFINCITTDILPPDIHNTIKKGSDYDFLLDMMEIISKNSDIIFDLHTILTKQTYKNLYKIILDLYKRNINFKMNIVNLHPHNFNDFTSPNNMYLSDNEDIKKELQKVKILGEKLRVIVNIPPPWEEAWKLNNGKCLSFWSRFQVVPDKNIPKEKWVGNVIPSQCNAVVIGKLFSLGNLFDYKNLMDFWNNEKLLKIRKNLVNGVYPDDMCKTCYKYSDKFDKSQ